MLEKRTFTVTVSIDVFDEPALIEAAKAKAIEDGTPQPDLTTKEAVQWMIDPGVSPPGTSINESFIEEYHPDRVP